MEVMKHASTFLLPQDDDKPTVTSALVVLNRRLPRFTPLLWKQAQLRISADGGANRLYDDLPKLFDDQNPVDICSRYKPDVIKGDMDSIRTEVKDFYTDMGTEIIDESHDQDTTDLHKCINYVCECTPNLDKSNVSSIEASAGYFVRVIIPRDWFDHELGNINVLYKFPNVRSILLSDDCLIYLLPKTHCHEIYIQSEAEGSHCGLIPIGAPAASTTTSGLQWDLTETKMHFGGLISTSNRVQEEKVVVSSDSDLLWTISLRKPSS